MTYKRYKGEQEMKSTELRTHALSVVAALTLIVATSGCEDAVKAVADVAEGITGADVAELAVAAIIANQVDDDYQDYSGHGNSYRRNIKRDNENAPIPTVELSSTPFGNGKVGDEYSHIVVADVKNGSGSYTHQMTVSDSLPPGLTAHVSNEYLTIRGTPTQPGTWNFTVTAQATDTNTDINLLPDEDTFQITIR